MVEGEKKGGELFLLKRGLSFQGWGLKCKKCVTVQLCANLHFNNIQEGDMRSEGCDGRQCSED